MSDIQEKKEKFYVFTGIDYTLNSKDWIDSNFGRVSYVFGSFLPAPHCMEALNKLIKGLETKYDVVLVITSRKRKNPDECLDYLRLAKLEYDGTIMFTKYIDGPRGEKIVDFLESSGASPLTYHTAPLYVRFLKKFKDNPDFKNYVVIDGLKRNLSRYIPKSQIKQVDLKYGLTNQDVDEILQKNNCLDLSQSEAKVNV